MRGRLIGRPLQYYIIMNQNLQPLTPAIAEILAAEHIEYAAAIPFSVCRVWNESKLAQFGFTRDTVQTALMFLVPYYPGESDTRRNISVYSAARDYHLYFKDFFARICEKLRNAFPGYRFSGSADNAPIDERHAAVTAGLGMYGDSGLLINETYGTYVFIGEILSDLPRELFCDEPLPFVPHDASCPHCGACSRACPARNNPLGIPDCLSAVTQTKKLSALCPPENRRTERDYINYIRYYGSAWGCDLCQTACPYNAAPKTTPIPFFRESLTPHVTAEEIKTMPEEAFRARAYAWRKRETIVRNLEILEADAAQGLPSADILDAIIAVVREAGDVMKHAHDVEAIDGGIDEKAGDANFVTVYDVRVQDMLMAELQKVLPDAKYFAEEKENDPEILWDGHTFIIDPIDGTTNFIHNYGISAISVGLLFRGKPVFGVIYDPYRDMLYEARRGIGAFCNGKQLHVSDRPIQKSLIAVGTAPYYRADLGDKTFAMMRGLYDRCADLRRLGSAALDLCAVAAGVADGYCELLISPWDFAAGALLVEEAGGIITDLDGQPLNYSRPTGVIAATERTHGMMLEVLQKL